MNKNNYCVIMAGGVGTRFWPLSKTKRPKQFIDIMGCGSSLIQLTFERFSKICPVENIFVVTNDDYKDLVLEHLPRLTASQVLCEPTRRNTAPCIVYANERIAKINPNANIIVTPSDHVILKEDVFEQILRSALTVAEQEDFLITLGIKPSFPNTGYGYIQFDEAKIKPELPLLRKVKLFTEKPVLELAEQFLKSGDFLWNAGIFVWSLKSISRAIAEYLPEIHELFSKHRNVFNTDKEARYIQEIYTACPSISIDYGIMEKASNVYVMISDFGWSDVGTWGSLHEILKKDTQCNSIVGKNVMTYDCENCLINVPKDKLVVLQGMKDYIVVESDGTLLICKKDQEQMVRKFVSDVEVHKGKKYV